MNCNACEEVRTKGAEFYQNGVTDTVCKSLKNNTGFNPSNSNNNCDDLDNANDCLIRGMGTEVNAYNVCDWRAFMKNFIKNLYQMIKAMVCAICGLNCKVDYLYNGDTFNIGESTSGDAYAVAGKGVSFLVPHGASQHTSDISLVYIAGGLIRGSGSYRFFSSSFTDEAAVGCFDNGNTMTVTKNRAGNSNWNNDPYNIKGGELICEFRIKKSAYPQIKKLFPGTGQESGGGSYHVRTLVFNEGDYAYGQHGWCDEDTGQGSESGYNDGHKVPSGWIYVQLRLTSAAHFEATSGGHQYSPLYYMGIRMNKGSINC